MQFAHAKTLRCAECRMSNPTSKWKQYGRASMSLNSVRTFFQNFSSAEYQRLKVCSFFLNNRLTFKVVNSEQYFRTVPYFQLAISCEKTSLDPLKYRLYKCSVLPNLMLMILTDEFSNRGSNLVYFIYGQTSGIYYQLVLFCN